MNHRAFFFVWVANRWLALRVELVGSLVAFSTAYSIVFFTKYNHGMDAGLAGLSLSYSLAFVEALLWIVRMHALMEMEMNAVERIDEYLNVEQESASIVDSYRPPENVSPLHSF
jgi:ABC-type multidrug transport system fused ATPase/permease subunit